MQLILGPIFSFLATFFLARALASIGVGVVVFSGFQFMKGQLEAYINSGLSSLPTHVYSLLSMAGFVDSIGLWLSGWTIIGAIAATKRFRIL